MWVASNCVLVCYSLVYLDSAAIWIVLFRGVEIRVLPGTMMSEQTC
jgi:hypothetical protein